MLELLADEELHVWHGTSHQRTAYADWAMLSSAERQRWWRLPPTAAARFAASYAARRHIAARYLDTPPALVEFGPAGAVVCEEAPPLAVSLSHAGDHWLLAVSRYPVGADIRGLGPVDDDTELARPDVAVPDVTRPQVAVPEVTVSEAEPELFFRCWTRKEALIKAARLHGHDLRSVDVDPDGEDEAVVESPDSRTQWLVRSLPAPDGASVAVAVPADEAGAVVMRSWPDRIQCGAA